MVENSQVQRQEITTLNRKLRAASDSNTRNHIKDSLMNWLNFYSKGNKDHEALLKILISHLRLNQDEESALKATIGLLKPKKRSFFG